MSFLQRVMNYVLNEYLVNRLANSPSFQRFAIRTDAMLAEKRKQVGEQVPQHLDEALSKSRDAVEQSQTFVQAFVAELTKGFRTGGGRS